MKLHQIWIMKENLPVKIAHDLEAGSSVTI